MVLQIYQYFSCADRISTYENLWATKDTDEVSAMNLRTIDYFTTLVSNFVKYG